MKVREFVHVCTVMSFSRFYPVHFGVSGRIYLRSRARYLSYGHGNVGDGDITPTLGVVVHEVAAELEGR